MKIDKTMILQSFVKCIQLNNADGHEDNLVKIRCFEGFYLLQLERGFHLLSSEENGSLEESEKSEYEEAKRNEPIETNGNKFYLPVLPSNHT